MIVVAAAAAAFVSVVVFGFVVLDLEDCLD